MTFNVSDFASTINSVGGLVKSNKFQVIITPNVQIGDNRIMSFMCDQATVPGVTWTTADVRHTGYGNFAKRPTNATFTDVQLQFFVDSDSNVMEYFHRWMANINNFDRSNAGARNGLDLYHFNYPDEYQAVIDIIVFDDNQKRTTEIKLNDAFPVAIGDQQLSWENTNSLLKLSVTIAYDSWSSNHFDASSTNTSTDRSRNQFSETPLGRTQTGEATRSDIPLPPPRPRNTVTPPGLAPGSGV